MSTITINGVDVPELALMHFKDDFAHWNVRLDETITCAPILEKAGLISSLKFIPYSKMYGGPERGFYTRRITESGRELLEAFETHDLLME